MLNPRCVITGCALILDGSWVAADLFDIGDWWLVNANHQIGDSGGVNTQWSVGEPPHHSKHITIIGPYWERRAVFLVNKSRMALNREALKHLRYLTHI